MKDFWRRAKPLVWGGLCIILALYLSPLNVIVGYAISTRDIAPIWATVFDPYAHVMQFLPGMLLTLAAFIFVIADAFEACLQRKRPPSRFFLSALFCLTILAPWFYMRAFLPSHWPARRAGLEAAAIRAKPLVAAIEKYKADKGQAPEELQDLVPRYLARVPQTGMVASPKFRYSRTVWEDGAQGYYLRIATGFALSSESFNYFSNQKYPARLYSGRVERIGNWAYVHKSGLTEK